MAKLRRKLVLPINLYETVNENRLKTGGALTATLYPAGVQIEGINSVVAGVERTIQVQGRGALEEGDALYLLDVDGTELVTSGLSITTDGGTQQGFEESDSTEGVFYIRITSDTTGFTTAAGQRFVAARTAGNRVSLYEDPTDITDTVDNPVDVPTNGVIECYLDVRGVDVYLEGDTIDNGWWFFDYPTTTGLTGPLRLETQVEAADTSVYVDADTAHVELDTDTAAIQTIKHCAPDRVLFLTPSVAGVQLTTVNTKADNTIYEAAGRDINLDPDVTVMLVGREASAGVSYWMPVAAIGLVDVGITDLNDVTESTPLEGQPLVYTAAGGWENSDALGTATDPIALMHIDHDSIVLVNASDKDARFSATALSTDQVYSFPDNTGEFLLTTGIQTITGRKDFLDGVSGLRLDGGSGFVSFDASALTTSRVVTIPDEAVTLVDASKVPVNLDDVNLADVSIGTPSDGDVLVYGSGTWFDGTALGTSSNRITSIACDTSSIQIYEATGANAAILAYATTADNTLTLPDDTGKILSENTAVFSATANFFFDDTAGSGLYDFLNNGANAVFVFRVPSVSGSPANGIVLKEANWMWNQDGPAGGVGPTSLEIYHDSTFPTGTTVPPSGTAITGANHYAPTTAYGSGVQTDTVFSDATVPAGNYIYLGIASSGLDPGTIGYLTLVLHYTLDV